MSEQEKMISGQLYNSTDEKLSEQRIKAKKLCRQYNNLEPDNYEERKSILKELLGKTKENFLSVFTYLDEIMQNQQL